MSTPTKEKCFEFEFKGAVAIQNVPSQVEESDNHSISEISDNFATALLCMIQNPNIEQGRWRRNTCRKKIPKWFQTLMNIIILQVQDAQ